MANMRCCKNCFVDEYLKERIRSNDEVGDCDFCRSENVYTINASGLYEDFTELLALYEPVQYGEHFHPEMDIEAIDVGEWLPQVIQDGWGDIFNYDRLNMAKQCDLLDEIRMGSSDYDYKNPPMPSNDLWTSKDKSFFHVSEEELWGGFCHHIKRDRRFILKAEGTLDPIADPKGWLPHLLPEIEMTFSPETPIYRARINPQEMTYQPLESGVMGAPCPERASGGRINAPGIPVLYAALEKATAVSEVHPEKGAHVTVATIHVKSSVRLVDITSVPTIPSPFACREGNLSAMISRNAFLRCLNHALATPVRKHDAEIEYVPNAVRSRSYQRCQL